MTTVASCEIGQASNRNALLVHHLTQRAFAEYANLDAPSTALKETLDKVEADVVAGAAIAKRDGEFVACVRFREEDDALYFYRLAVLPEYRRQGIASSILDWLADEARRRSLTRLTCSVRLELGGNVRLYERHGFVQVGQSTLCRDGTPVPTGHLEKRL